MGRDRPEHVLLWVGTGTNRQGLETGKGMDRYELWTRTCSDRTIVLEKDVETSWCIVPEEIQTPESLQSTRDL